MINCSDRVMCGNSMNQVQNETVTDYNNKTANTSRVKDDICFGRNGGRDLPSYTRRSVLGTFCRIITTGPSQELSVLANEHREQTKLNTFKNRNF